MSENASKPSEDFKMRLPSHLVAIMQSGVFQFSLLLYILLWWLVSAIQRYAGAGHSKSNRNGGKFDYIRSWLRSVIYQQGWFTWSDTQRWYGAVTNAHGLPRMHHLLSKPAWQTGSWKMVSNKVYHLRVRAHALIWRVTSFHVKLHVRAWIFVLEWLCCRLISDRILKGAGEHVDVLQNHKFKFFLASRLPLRVVSRCWGRMCQMKLPLRIRGPLLRLYIRVFGVKLDEAVITDLDQYETISMFFRRSLKSHLRSIDKVHNLTSPADGTVLNCGVLVNGRLEQVKEVTYSIRQFMGNDSTFMDNFQPRRVLCAKSSTSQTVKYMDAETNYTFGTDIHVSPELVETNQLNPEYSELDTSVKCSGKFDEGYAKLDQLSDGLGTTANKSDCHTPKKDDCLKYDECIQINANDLVRFHHDKCLKIHSSYTKTPIICSRSNSQSSFELEEHILEEIFEINEDDWLKHDGKPISEHTEMLLNQQPFPPVEPVDSQVLLMKREGDFADKIILNKSNVLHQCVIYLAPGDYHRFHSPADWTVYSRRHFSGNLFSVNPNIAKWLQSLFTLNERVLYTGRWKYGFFSMTAVGATNVGTINVFFDQTLNTNNPEADTDRSTYEELHFRSRDQPGIRLSRGQLMGDFNLGSTIVLLFEAPPAFQFSFKPGDRVKYGQGMTSLANIQRRRKSRAVRN